MRKTLRRATAAPSDPPSNATAVKTYSTFRSGSYNAGSPNEQVAGLARAAGQAGVLNTDVVGENSHGNDLDYLTDQHGAATGIIGHGLRGDVQEVAGRLDVSEPQVQNSEQTAVHAIDVWKSSEKLVLAIKQQFVGFGLPLPTRKQFVLFALCLVTLFVGDWALIAVGFQLFGLSDKPWIPGVGFTDDLHLAAVSSVAFLVFLGERAGEHARRIELPLERRRLTLKEERKDLPFPGVHDVVALLVCVGVALYGLYALSTIRAEYLLEQGINAQANAFFGIQTAIFVAAVAIGFAHSSPDAKRYRSAESALKKAAADENVAVGTHVDLVGTHNRDVDALDALVAEAGHHVDTSAGHTLSQHDSYKSEYVRAQQGDEIAQKDVFASKYKTPTEYGPGELLERLTGITKLPSFEKVSADKVIKYRAAAHAEASRLRARIDQIEINELGLPDLDETDYQPDDEKTEESELETASSGHGRLRQLSPVDPETTDDATDEESA